MLLEQVMSAPSDARILFGAAVTIAITAAGALIILTYLGRGRLAHFLGSLHIGQFAILMLPGILALGFYYEAAKGLGGGPYGPLVDLISFFGNSGVVGGVLAAVFVGLGLCLPLQMVMLLWIWFGTKDPRKSQSIVGLDVGSTFLINPLGCTPSWVD